MFEFVFNILLVFVSFFVIVVILFVVFFGFYVFVMLYSELCLIGEGNIVVVISLGGVVIGFVLFIVVVVVVSYNLYMMVGWGVVVGLV